MFQPAPGIYENVEEIDFTSMYPTIIVQANLSPETIEHPERAGFLPAALKPLLDLRINTKRLKKNRSPVCRHRFNPEMDACHLFWIYRLQECKVREDRSTRRDHGEVKRYSCPHEGYCRRYGFYGTAR